MGSTLATALDELGFEPYVVRSLVAARLEIATRHPVLVVLDLTLEDEFGADLLAELSEHDDAPPTVVVSGFALAPMIAERFGLHLVRKPFGLDDFLHAAERVFTGRIRPQRVA